MKKSLIAGGLLILFAAVAVQFGGDKKASPGKGHHLASVLPANLPGWSARDVPLGPTEEVRGAVEKTLHYDDVFFREYRSDRGVISVYAAYWGPGGMPTQLVASHTPDRCWVENGWRCDSVRHEVGLVGVREALRAGEWRIFAAPGQQKLQVQFWHLVGNETYDYGDRTNKVPSVWRWWRDAARQAFQSPPEQYFIRLTSERPFEELKGDPGWEEMLAALAKLGLADVGGQTTENRGP